MLRACSVLGLSFPTHPFSFNLEARYLSLGGSSCRVYLCLGPSLSPSLLDLILLGPRCAGSSLSIAHCLANLFHFCPQFIVFGYSLLGLAYCRIGSLIAL